MGGRGRPPLRGFSAQTIILSFRPSEAHGEIFAVADSNINGMSGGHPLRGFYALTITMSSLMPAGIMQASNRRRRLLASSRANGVSRRISSCTFCIKLHICCAYFGRIIYPFRARVRPYASLCTNCCYVILRALPEESPLVFLCKI